MKRYSRSLAATALLLGFASAFFLGHQASAKITPYTLSENQTALAVSMLMEGKHLTRHPLDDEMSKRCLSAFLKTLDPLKMYFNQSDVDEFMKRQTDLDDMFRRGKVNFSQTVFNRFIQRVDERIAIAVKMVGIEHDFTLKESMIRDRDTATYAKNKAEARDRWRKRVKYDLLVKTAELAEKKADKTDKKKKKTDKVTAPLTEAEKLAKIKQKLVKRYESIQKRWHQTSSDELLEYYLTSMTSGFDPHSSYMSRSTLDNFEIMMKLELDGIGASLRSIDGYTTVERVIPGGAADKHGKLEAEDRIVAVAQGTDGEMVDIIDMKLNDVVNKVRGKRGSIVRLKVEKGEGGKYETYQITRARIELKDSEARGVVIKHGVKSDGSPYKIGVIQLPSFYMDMNGARLGIPNFKSTTRDVRHLIEGFKKQGIDCVMVDLRFNGGGSLTESVRMTGLFIDRGPVVQVKGPDGRTLPYDDDEAGMAWGGPLVVLSNKFSASASEIFAGAIQDYRRGILIGDHTTHGKGTVQQLFDLDNRLFRRMSGKMGALKLTIQQFYRPGGDSTQNRGVVSDVELPSITTHMDVGEDALDHALAFDRVKRLNFQDYHLVNPSYVTLLKNKSTARCDVDKGFSRAKERIKYYEEQKDRKTVTLNRVEYLAERARFNSDKENERQAEKATGTDRPVFEMDFYGKEAMSITTDYIEILKSQKVAVLK